MSSPLGRGGSSVLPAYAGMIRKKSVHISVNTVLPAYAGMIRRSARRAGRRACAPRVCGDDPKPRPGPSRGPGVLPAYAGMIRPGLGALSLRVCAPRVCGDDPTLTADARSGQACSPRMRG